MFRWHLSAQAPLSAWLSASAFELILDDPVTAAKRLAARNETELQARSRPRCPAHGREGERASVPVSPRASRSEFSSRTRWTPGMVGETGGEDERNGRRGARWKHHRGSSTALHQPSS